MSLVKYWCCIHIIVRKREYVYFNVYITYEHSYLYLIITVHYFRNLHFTRSSPQFHWNYIYIAYNVNPNPHLVLKTPKYIIPHAEKEQFFYDTAQKYLLMHPDVKYEEIFSKDGKLKRFEFFGRYFKEYNTRRGVHSDKRSAKRMFDGIQRFFMRYYEEFVRSQVRCGFHITDIVAKIKDEAEQYIA